MNRRIPPDAAHARGSETGTVPAADALREIMLPAPKAGRGKSVAGALLERRTIRSIRDRKLPQQLLSNLLWSACGINRMKGPFGGPGSTAASASNAREIDVYVALEEGLYLYEAIQHQLLPVRAGDLRSLAIGRGQSASGAKAPVRLIYVADIEKFGSAGFQEPGLQDPETQKAYYFVDTGMIAANVYLFAASQGLASWFHNCDREGIAAALRLGNKRRALFGQTVGYPL